VGDVALEVCVDCAEGLAAAVAGGADRIELCSALEVGGLTPSSGLMRAAAGIEVPVYAMIRPRAGGFVFTARDVAVMRADIAAVRAAGLAGVVLGASRRDGRLDEAVLAELTEAATRLGLTLHRAFDLVPDVAGAVEVAVRLGFRRILTSGGAAAAPLGVARLRETLAAAWGRVSVMPGAGITPERVGALRGLPVVEVHASCSEPGEVAPLGFGAPRRTSAAKVRALKAALVDLGRGSG
jgi:copper homeostasis protein